MSIRRHLAMARRAERGAGPATRHGLGSRVVTARAPKLLRASTRLAAARTRVSWAPAVVNEPALPAAAAPALVNAPALSRAAAPALPRRAQPDARPPGRLGRKWELFPLSSQAIGGAARVGSPWAGSSVRAPRAGSSVGAGTGIRAAGDHAGEPGDRAGQLRVAVRRSGQGAGASGRQCRPDRFAAAAIARAAQRAPGGQAGRTRRLALRTRRPDQRGPRQTTRSAGAGCAGRSRRGSGERRLGVAGAFARGRGARSRAPAGGARPGATATAGP